MKSKAKKAVFGVVMVVLVLGVCFVVLEFVFAKFYYSDVYRIALVKFDPVVGWRFKPGTHQVKPPNSFVKHAVYINDLGVRSKDISPTKPEGVKRIMILGDSFVFARALPSEKTFPVKMEEILNGTSARETYEVINAGITGFGTAQQLLLIQEFARQGIVADVYVVMQFSNDILDNARLFYHDLSENIAQPRFVLDSAGQLVLKDVPDETGKRVRQAADPTRTVARAKVIDVLRHRIASFTQTRPSLLRFLNKVGMKIELPRLPGIVSAWYDEERLTDGIPLMKALLAKIKEQTEAYDSQFFVCFIPSQFQVYPDAYGPMLRKSFPQSEAADAFLEDMDRPQRIVGEMCEDLGIPYLNLLPIMRENNRKSLYIAAEGHFSSNAHEIVARTLADFLILHRE